MQLVIVNKIKTISIIFLLIAAIGIVSAAQAGKKSYRSGYKGGFSIGYKSGYGYGGSYGYKNGYSNSHRRNYSYGRKGYSRGYNRGYGSGRHYSHNSYYPYRNYAFRSYNDHGSSKVVSPHHKSATTVIIASAAAATVNSEKNASSEPADTILTCYDYRLTSIGGVGGFKFNDAKNSIKVANDTSIVGQFCGSKFIEFELAKIDENVSVDFKIDGKVFKFPARSESVQQDGWKKKFFSVNFK